MFIGDKMKASANTAEVRLWRAKETVRYSVDSLKERLGRGRSGDLSRVWNAIMGYKANLQDIKEETTPKLGRDLYEDEPKVNFISFKGDDRFFKIVNDRVFHKNPQGFYMPLGKISDLEQEDGGFRLENITRALGAA
jgi:hypothetical protein